MSSLGVQRSVGGCLPGCSNLACSLLVLPMGQLAVGCLAPGCHQEYFVLLTDTKVRKSPSLPSCWVPWHWLHRFPIPLLCHLSFQCCIGPIWGDKQAVTYWAFPAPASSFLLFVHLQDNEKICCFWNFLQLCQSHPTEEGTCHHSQCADQETTALRGLVVSSGKKYQSQKSEALLHHLDYYTHAAQNPKIHRVLSHHMSWAPHTSRYLQWEILGDKDRQIPAKKNSS